MIPHQPSATGANAIVIDDAPVITTPQATIKKPIAFTHLVMPDAPWTDLLEMAASSPACEICGLILGARVGTYGIAERLVPSANHFPGDRSRAYKINWNLLATTLFDSNRRGAEWLGVYHSHPKGIAVPSLTDAREAWPSLAYVIIGDASNGPEVAAWELDESSLIFSPINLTQFRPD